MILHNKENSLINYDWMMLQLNLSVLGSSGGEKEKRQMRKWLMKQKSPYYDYENLIF